MAGDGYAYPELTNSDPYELRTLMTESNMN